MTNVRREAGLLLGLVVGLAVSGCGGPVPTSDTAAGGAGPTAATSQTTEPAAALNDSELAAMEQRLNEMRARMDAMSAGMHGASAQTGTMGSMMGSARGMSGAMGSMMGGRGAPNAADMQAMMDGMREMREQMQGMMDTMGTPGPTGSSGLPMGQMDRMQAMMATMESMMGTMQGMADGAGMGGMMSGGESMGQMMQQMRAMHGQLDSRLPAGSNHHPTPTAGETGMEDGHGAGSYTFGEPADPSTATRVIELRLLDAMKFDPPAVEVKLGETVTLRAINTSVLAHDFTLGDQALQDAHEAEMVRMGGAMPDEPNAFLVPTGQSRDLTWKFTQAGDVLYACHSPGHYASGMIGHITVK